MNSNLWENLWSREDSDALFSRLEHFYRLKSRAIDIFKDFGAVRICDAACGYGAYSVAFSSNGFEVYSFDVSPTAAMFTRMGLEHYGFDGLHVKSADILSTGYPDAFFDGVIANSVLDHMSVADAKKSLSELCRITKPDGIIMVSFDWVDEDDMSLPHELLSDGSILYTSGSRRGMILHPYNESEALCLLEGFEIVYTELNLQDEQVFIFKNSPRFDVF